MVSLLKVLELIILDLVRTCHFSWLQVWKQISWNNQEKPRLSWATRIRSLFLSCIHRYPYIRHACYLRPRARQFLALLCCICNSNLCMLSNTRKLIFWWLCHCCAHLSGTCYGAHVACCHYVLAQNHCSLTHCTANANVSNVSRVIPQTTTESFHKQLSASNFLLELHFFLCGVPKVEKNKKLRRTHALAPVASTNRESISSFTFI